MDINKSKKAPNSSIRVCRGSQGRALMGTVGDMLKHGILQWCDYHRSAWCMLPSHGEGAMFAHDRAECEGYARAHCDGGASDE